jgi:hypothetical protein
MPKVFALVITLVSCLVLLALVGISPASAQEKVYYAQSGRPIPILVFFNCGPRGVPQGASGAAQHGIVTARYTTGNRCGNPRQPIVLMIYTSRPGFRGQDEAIFYGYGASIRRRIIVR